MDTIGASGVRFAQAISPAPVTLPAHASLLTGLDPPQHGVRHNSVYRLDGGIPTLAEHLRDADFATAAFVGALVLDRRFGLARGFDHYDDALREGAGTRRSGLVGYAERPANRVVDAAAAWLADAPSRFFLWAHFYDPHTAYAPPAGFASAFANRPYAGEIAFVDVQVGRLLEAVRARFGDEGLVVALTSDHGESLGEHGELTHAYTLYDATQRVPLLLRGPGLPVGRVVEDPVRLVDLAPTLLELAGAAALPEIEGRSLLPLVARAEEPPREAYVETLATQLDFGWSPLLGLRSGPYKYIRAPRPELYDLRDDPGETRNLAGGLPEIVARLDRALEARARGARAPRTDVELDVAERAQLRALGYVAAAESVERPDLGSVGGPDPKDHVSALRALAEAETLLTKGRARDALARLAEVEEGGVRVEALRAVAAVTAGEAIEAERAARAALALEPRRPDLMRLLAQSLQQQGRAEEARAAYESAEALASPGESRDRPDPR